MGDLLCCCGVSVSDEIDGMGWMHRHIMFLVETMRCWFKRTLVMPQVQKGEW